MIDEKVPTGHGIQSLIIVDPFIVLKVPDGHGLHFDCPNRF